MKEPLSKIMLVRTGVDNSTSSRPSSTSSRSDIKKRAQVVCRWSSSTQWQISSRDLTAETLGHKKISRPCADSAKKPLATPTDGDLGG